MAEVNHETRQHALLSASGASRWLNCTPSARLEEKFDASGNSIYAEEGTLAHEFGDINLRYKNGELSDKVFKAEIKKLRAHKLFAREMETEVDKYVSFVLETFAVAKSKTPSAVLLIEQRLDFSHLVEKGFGTGDACIIADGILDITDLKYGKGIAVDATENEQLMLYGSGALRAFELSYDIHTVRLTIVQPRLDHISTWEISVEDLIKWGEEVVKPKAAEAYAGEGIQVAGDHCKWCKVKPMCATLAAKNLELAKMDFADPHLLTDEQLLGIFQQQPMLVDWANAVAQYILDQAIKGKQWKGFKLVEGRSNRAWIDETEVIKVLRDSGFNEEQIFNKKLNPITQIEKTAHKDFFVRSINPLINKPQGKPTLVPEADERPVFNSGSAKEDFG